MGRRRGVSAETPHVSSCLCSCCRSQGGESVVCRLDRPRFGPLVEAVADSARVVRLQARTPWSRSYSSRRLISFSCRRSREALMELRVSRRLLMAWRRSLGG
jgi:hypothetical protein